MGLDSKSGGGINRETHANIDHTVAPFNLAPKEFLNLNRVKLPTPAISDYVTPSAASPSSQALSLLSGFETPANWTYSEVDSNATFSDGGGSTVWFTEGAQSYLIDKSGIDASAVSDYGAISQSFDLTDVGAIRFDVKIAGYDPGLLDFEVRVGGTLEKTIAGNSDGSAILNNLIDVSSYSGTQSIEFRLTPNTTGTGDCQGYVDDLEGGSHMVGYSFDDDTTTYWQPSPVNETGAWLDLDTGSLSIIGSCRIYANTNYAPTIKVEVSDDGSTWTEVAIGIKLTGGGWKEITWNARYCRYIRVTVTDYGTESGIQIADSDYYSRIIDRVSSEHGHGSGITEYKKGHGKRIKPYKTDKEKTKSRRIDELEEQVQLLRDMTGV